MLPLAHIYVSTKVTKRKSPLLVFGSVLPDISWTSTSQIGRDKLHNSPFEFYNFVTQAYPEFTDLGLGVKLHSAQSKGADYYSDGLNSDGFAYTEGTHIESDVCELLEIDSNVLTKKLSHNFIEAGVDICLLNEKPNLLTIYQDSINKIELDQIGNLLGEYLGIEATKSIEEVKNFIKFIDPEAYNDSNTLLERFAFIIQKRTQKQVSPEKLSATINKAVLQITPKYKEILNTTIQSMSKDFSNF